MPTIPLHLPCRDGEREKASIPNPLPQLLQTPTGLAILEIQGTINLPASTPNAPTTPIGRLVFPDHTPEAPANDQAWMKRVHLYVGQHQRLTGEVKKLPQAVAVMRKRDEGADDLEIVEIVYWKVLFSSRPEPVGI